MSDSKTKDVLATYGRVIGSTARACQNILGAVSNFIDEVFTYDEAPTDPEEEKETDIEVVQIDKNAGTD